MRPTKLLAALLLTTLTGSALAADLVVSAAASLTNAFKDIGTAYEAQYSGVLLQQIAKGAPVDVFASADQETMDKAQAQNLVLAADRHDFVRNSLVLIVPSDSKLQVADLAALGQPGVTRIAVGNPASVPVGAYTQRTLEAASLWSTVQAKAITTQNVRQSLDYVARGEVDAGFVYGTDAALMSDKVKVAFTVPVAKPISYPIAKTKDSANGSDAQRFVSYIQSAPAQAIFAKYGFLKP
jgi:molybdate transport system substrate-binding protein